MDLNISISRDSILNTITHSAAYTGAKFVGDEDAYKRIHTSDVDREKLLQLWEESIGEIEEKFQGVLQSIRRPQPLQPQPLSEPENEEEEGEESEEEETPTVDTTPDTSDTFIFVFDVPSNFDGASSSGIHRNLCSFLCSSILGKWFVYTNKEEAGAYADHAQTFLNAAHSLIHERKKPKRPTLVDKDDPEYNSDNE